MMGTNLDLDDVAATSCLAKSELMELRKQRDELLEILKLVLPEISICCTKEMLEQARAAIQKATA